MEATVRVLEARDRGTPVAGLGGSGFNFGLRASGFGFGFRVWISGSGLGFRFRVSILGFGVGLQFSGAPLLSRNEMTALVVAGETFSTSSPVEDENHG